MQLRAVLLAAAGIGLLGPAALVVLTPAAPTQASPTSGSLSNGGYYRMTSTKLTFTVAGGLSVECTDGRITSNLVAVNATQVTAAGGGGASHVIIDKCKAPLNVDVTVATGGTWSVTGKDRTATGPPELWNVGFTIDSAVLTVPSTKCVVTLDSPQTMTGSFNDDDPPALPNTSMTLNGLVSFTSNQTGVGCPKSPGQATVQATFAVSANTKQDFTGSGVVVNFF